MEFFITIDHQEQVIHVMFTPENLHSCLHGDLYQPVRPGEWFMDGVLSYDELLELGNGSHVIAAHLPAT